MRNLSIVIPSSGELVGLWATIANCIEACGKFDYEIIAVVNGTPLTTNHKRHESRNVRFVHSESPLGPAGAREFGAKESTGEFLFFLDDHCVVPHDLFDKVQGHGPLVFCPSKSLFDGPAYYHYLISPAILETMDASISENPAREKPYPCLSAQNGQFLIRRQEWEQIGGYNSLFNGYSGEEVYIGMKAWMYGLVPLIHPQAVMWHHSRMAPYKAHDEAYADRFRGGLNHLRSLSTKYSLATAFARATSLCPQ